MAEFDNLHGEAQAPSIILTEIIESTKNIISKEIQLARLELKDEMTKLKKGLISLGLFFVVSLISLLLFSHGLVLFVHSIALYNYPVWVSYAAVTIFLIGCAFLALKIGKEKLKKVSLIPSGALETLR